MAHRRSRLAAAGVLAVALVAAALVSLTDLTPRRRLNVLIVTVESFRADAVSATLTPQLWAAARQGLRFTNHRAVSAWTVPNIVAVLEGLSPFDQGIHTRGNYLPASWPLPLKSLAAAGWRVASLQAFANMDVYRHLGLEVETGVEPVPWLARRALGRQPFVLWYHYLDTHLPYAPPPPFEPDWRALLPPDDPAALTATQMDQWAKQFDNWAICDTTCFHLFDKSPLAWSRIRAWHRRKDEFVRRAAFALNGPWFMGDLAPGVPWAVAPLPINGSRTVQGMGSGCSPSGT